MSHGQYFRFDDPHQFQTAIRATMVEVLAISRGGFRSDLTRIDLDRLWMQGNRSRTSYIMRGVNDPARVPIMFLADATGPPVRHNGLELSPDEIVVFRRGAANDVVLEGPNALATMSLTPEELAATSRAMVGQELCAPSHTGIIRPARDLMANLRTLHNAASQLARTSPALLTHPATARALENELVRAMVACLAPTPGSAPRHGLRHATVIARFEDFLAAKRYEPVYLTEMCGAIGVSERTLRSCCQEHLGVGPIRYLWLRRMHLARRSLVGADPARETVTEVATAHGFWELGRFSVEYRTLFGESPSATLKRPPEELEGPTVP